MKLLMCLAAFAAVCFMVDSKNSPAKVQVYSRNPGEFGKANTLICHVSDFHPPDIKIQLMKDGMEIPNADQTDLAFKQGWLFHLTKNVDFTPTGGEKYSCRVTHGGVLKDYAWEPNM
ncbi:beta-2-microglobulin [Lates calcarifer]|uniref:Beta-2-microglobulin n=1 Tax=Lates calcarifer TaxID=8187 RepID=D2CZZ6_LATCA|nr:beta-2-microglobulin [Lates calcarifer]ACN32201.1 beta2-microglobulin [Lates calcarifer]